MESMVCGRKREGLGKRERVSVLARKTGGGREEREDRKGGIDSGRSDGRIGISKIKK